MEHKGRYGYNRISIQLKSEGFSINHKTVYRIMKEENLKNVRRRRHYHSYKGEIGKVAKNIVNRNFMTTAPNQKWTTDVTQINIGEEKCYLSPILDMYNGEIVCYTISDHPNLKMVIRMLDKAYESRKIEKGLILHSDQGWHYQHYNYQLSLKRHGNAEMQVFSRCTHLTASPLRNGQRILSACCSRPASQYQGRSPNPWCTRSRLPPPPP